VKFEQYKDKIVSLDIETSGLKPSKDWIWSIGLSGKDKEYFIDPEDPSAKDRLFKKDIFKQKGYFDDYNEASRRNKTVSIDKAINQLWSDIDRDSAIIIQNINFEDKFLGDAIANMGSTKEFRKKMMYRNRSASSNRLLDTPPEITSMRDVAKREYLSHIYGDKSSFNKVEKTYSDMMKSYEKHLGMKNKGVMVIELMDITKATYAKAAKMNLLDKGNLSTGLTVEFLSKALLGEKEEHTALDDAKKQKKIFNKLTSIYGELESGNISTDTKDRLQRIRYAQPMDSSRQFVAGFKRILEELKTDGEVRILDGLTTPLSEKKVSIDGPEETITRLTRSDYSSSKVTSDLGELTSNLQTRFKGMSTPNIDQNALIKETLGKETYEERIEFLAGKESKLKSDTISRVSGETKQSFTDKMSDTSSRISSKFKEIPVIKKRLGMAALAGLAIYGISSSDEDMEKIRNIKEKKKEKIDTDNIFHMYSRPRPKVYHGTGLAQWNDRTQSHQY
jgi:hypothetical protein